MNLKTHIRPVLLLTFLVIVWLDYIILPSANAIDSHLHCRVSPYTPFTTPEFWLTFAAAIIAYTFGRTAEKIKGVSD